VCGTAPFDQLDAPDVHEVEPLEIQFLDEAPAA